MSLSKTSELPRRLIVLGATGSIGTNTLDVAEHLARCGRMRFDVVGLAAGNNVEALLEAARRFDVKHVAIAEESHASALRDIPNVYAGANAALDLIKAIARPGDLVVGAMVGSAGLPATLAAIERGCDIALANKETLVAAGAIVMPLVREKGVNLLPVDSEHSAIFQCLQQNGATSLRRRVEMATAVRKHGSHTDDAERFDVSRVVITASGGPFRTWSKDRLESATVDEALNHPTWNMGPKVTIDSASMMNKALEVIEAHWLFDLPADRIETIVHPQSIIHSFVEFEDGSVLAQLGPPDMRTPIQYALTWPDRAPGISSKLDWKTLRQMDFEPVDHGRFGAVRLAYEVIERGGTAGAIFNAANEEAVAAFIAGKIRFGEITRLVRNAMHTIDVQPVRSLDDVMQADAAAREFVMSHIDSALAGVNDRITKAHATS